MRVICHVTLGITKSYSLSEAIWLTDRSNVSLLVDKVTASGERFPVDVEQFEFLYFIFQHAQSGSRSQTLSLFQSAPIITILAALAEPSLSAISAAGIATTCTSGA